MLNEISRQAQATVSDTFSARQEAQAASGKLIGKAVVQVVSPQSVLEDAMEELSYNFNKSADYALKSRKERDQAQRSIMDRMNAFRKVAEANGVADKDEVADLTQAIQDKPEREEILHEALERHEEPADAWAALQEVRDQLIQRGAAPDLLKELDEALALMDMRYGAAIRAGISGALTAAENYVSLGSPLDLGATYRKATLEFTSTMDLYTFIQEKHGGDFDKAVDFLYASLASDMACDMPSADKASLESVNTSFGKLRSFQSAHTLCDAQMRRWEEIHDVHDCGMKGMQLLGKVLQLGSQTFAGASDADSIARTAGAPDIERRILFLQELQQNVRNFSPLVFDSTEGRTRVLDAVQGAVDNAVTEEDALLASKE
ncbi:MAG: type III secretion system gatekeeper subunit SctW [Desulfovibrio sp.]|nr:type III secretion system gatekeeper subunit SctW [Desulfovibrio sp.]